MFWACHGAPVVDDSAITRSSFAGAFLLVLLAGLGISFVFPLCIGVRSSLLGYTHEGC